MNKKFTFIRIVQALVLRGLVQFVTLLWNALYKSYAFVGRIHYSLGEFNVSEIYAQFCMHGTFKGSLSGVTVTNLELPSWKEVGVWDTA